MTTIRQRVRVLPGGRIEITDPALVEGAELDAVVSLHDVEEARDVFEAIGTDTPGDGAATERAPSRLGDAYSLLDMIGAAPSGRTADEVDRDLRALRDEWDRRFP